MPRKSYLITKFIESIKLREVVLNKWFFPGILLCFVILLSILHISGSSIGYYHKLLYGADSKDPYLLFNQPEAIRSDEWLVLTPFSIAQKSTNFNEINTNLGNGADMSVSIDVPYRDWSSVFKPQNLPYLFLPLEVAFALHWWLLGYLLIVSVYLFVLYLMPKRKLFAVLLSLAFFLTPFVQWWYLTITLAPIYYTLFAIIISIHLLRPMTRVKRVLYSTLLTYVLACFALVMYPPFQICCALSGAFFFIGYLIEEKYSFKKLAYPAISVGSAAILAGAVVFLFYKTRTNVFNLVTNTVYPGKRTAGAGGYKLSHLFSGFLNYNLAKKGIYSFSNQSEAANFFLLIPGFAVATGYILLKLKTKKNYAILIGLNILLLILLGQMFLPFLPVFISKIFVLNIIPLNRLLMGIGMISFFEVIALARYFDTKRLKVLPRAIIALAVGLQFVVLSYSLRQLRHFHPLYVGLGRRNLALAIFVVLLICFMLYQLLKGRLVIFAILLFGLSLFATYNVNPLYKGLAIGTDTELSHKIKEINANKPGTWILLDDGYLDNYLLMNGVKTLSGIYVYPQKELWQEIDNSIEANFTYNRYARVVFTNIPNKQPINLLYADTFEVEYHGCNNFYQKHVNYVISESPLSDQCSQQIDYLKLPAKEFWFYRVVSQTP